MLSCSVSLKTRIGRRLALDGTLRDLEALGSLGDGWADLTWERTAWKNAHIPRVNDPWRKSDPSKSIVLAPHKVSRKEKHLGENGALRSLAYYR